MLLPSGAADHLTAHILITLQ